jgi:NDP-sugar pyrophosphorylase family protein
VRLHREIELLGTGGGIGTMSDSVSSADFILLHNGDIVSDIPYGPAIELHRRRGALVTLILVPSGPRANVAVGAEDEVIAIGEDAEKPGRGAKLLGYTGLAVLSPEALSFFPRGRKEQLVAVLREMMRARHGSVIGWNAAERGAAYAWGDAGSPAGYLGIHRAMLLDRVRFDPDMEPHPCPVYFGGGTYIHPSASCAGFCAIGRRVHIGPLARLENCVVLDGMLIQANEIHSNEILFPGGALKAEGGPHE